MKATIEHTVDGYKVTTDDGRTYHRVTLAQAVKTCGIIGASTHHII